jgi:tRNA(Ile)-lysidine synthase
MSEWCHAHAVTYLCIAHQLEDQAETFLMRLARGSGLDGLSAMHPITQAYGLTLLRPLLHTSRAEIEATLTARGQAWLNDPTNQKQDYTRNRMRRLLPVLAEEGLTPARMLQATQHFARASDCLNTLAEEWIDAHVTWQDGTAMLPCTPFLTLHEELALRVLRTLLRQVADSGDGEIRFVSLEPLLHAMRTSEEQFRTRTLHHCVVRKQEEGYCIVRELNA